MKEKKVINLIHKGHRRLSLPFNPQKSDPNEPVFNPIHVSNFPRIKTLVSTATYVFNLNQGVGNVEDKSNNNEESKFDEVLESTQDVLSSAQYGLKTYRLVRDFFKIIIEEQYELQNEFDSFFYHSKKILMNKHELLEMLSLEKYYEQIQKLVNTKTETYKEFDNQLVFQANDVVDKLRHFLLGINNLRNLGSYYHYEAIEKKDLNKSWDDKNTLEKVESGEEMLTFILNLKEKTNNLLLALPSGIEKIGSVRQDCLKILRNMYKLVPLKNSISIMSLVYFAMIFMLFFRF